ncbi:MAG TPA: hypothetical protein VNK81_08305 [Thermodesulfobacteriota bacterium]|nr:hypothetical protein [Thermodesulfobacteriota bacterium]
MRVICSWCGKSIKEKEPLGDKSVSHGICEGCSKKIKNGGTGFRKRLKRRERPGF